jgi:hypothetical protein
MFSTVHDAVDICIAGKVSQTRSAPLVQQFLNDVGGLTVGVRWHRALAVQGCFAALRHAWLLRRICIMRDAIAFVCICIL